MELGLSMANLIDAADKGMVFEGVEKIPPPVYQAITRAVAAAIFQNNKRLAEQLQEMDLANSN